MPTHNILIEFDGEQHFAPVEIFVETKRRDSEKNEYAKLHGIRLLRIKYTQFKN